MPTVRAYAYAYAYAYVASENQALTPGFNFSDILGAGYVARISPRAEFLQPGLTNKSFKRWHGDYINIQNNKYKIQRFRVSHILRARNKITGTLRPRCF